MKIFITLIAAISALCVFANIKITKKDLDWILIYPSVAKTELNDTIVTYKYKNNLYIQKYIDTIQYPSNYKLYLAK